MSVEAPKAPSPSPSPSPPPYDWYWLLVFGYLASAGGYLYYYGRR